MVFSARKFGSSLTGSAKTSSRAFLFLAKLAVSSEEVQLYFKHTQKGACAELPYSQLFQCWVIDKVIAHLTEHCSSS